MKSSQLLTLIKKAFSKGLKPSERVDLSKEEPMEQLLWKQWEYKADTHLKDKIDSSQLWNHIVDTCWGEKKRNDRRIRSFKWYSLSAAVVALLVLGIWTANNMLNSYIKVVAPNDMRLALTLPDSSKVWLNAGSTLQYRKSFDREREVLLEGEAFFDVEKNPNLPFRVYFNDAFVEVKGTEFNIKSSMTQASISLFSGRIDFTADGKEEIPMKPFECIVYTVKGQTIEKKTINTEYDWRSDEYKFVDKPLKELVEFIDEFYHVRLIMNDLSSEQYLFTGIIKKEEPLTNVLEKICLTMELNYKMEGDSIVIY